MTQPFLDWAEEVTVQALTEQIQQEKNPELLFRQDSLSTKMWSGFARLIGKKYLEAYAPIIKKIVRDGPAKCEALLKEKDKFLGVVESFIKVLVASFGKIPKSMKLILKTISLSLFAKFPQYPLGGLSSLFFLRFLCPALSTATNYGIITMEVPAAAKKLLVAVSKVLQNLANNVLFDPHDHLSFANGFVQENYKIMIVLLRKIAEKDMFDVTELKSSVSQPEFNTSMKQPTSKFDFNLDLEQVNRTTRAYSFDVGDASSTPSSVTSCAETPTPSSVLSFECLSANNSFSFEPFQSEENSTVTPLSSLSENVTLDTISEPQVALWSSLDVSIWLRKIKLGSYIRNFLYEGITGQRLLDLDEKSLVQLGVMKSTTRIFLLKQVKFLKRNAGMWTSCDSICTFVEDESDGSESGSEAEDYVDPTTENATETAFEDEHTASDSQGGRSETEQQTQKVHMGLRRLPSEGMSSIAHWLDPRTKTSTPSLPQLQHPHIHEIQRREIRSKTLNRPTPPAKDKK